jgi:glycosyltransferase involved in cell wall biosynthesis
MPTRGNPVLVARAIRGFQLQSWPERELVIVTSQTSAALDRIVAADSRIRLHTIPAGLTLGDQRNLSVARAQGAYLATWDDDDCHAPERLSTCMQVLLDSEAQVVYLRRVLIWMQLHHRLGVSCEGVWENTMVARRSALPAYPALERGSDTAVRLLMEQRNRLVCIDQPDLYAYCHTGANTWEAEHFLGFLIAGGAEFRGDAYVQAMAYACFRCLRFDGFF